MGEVTPIAPPSMVRPKVVAQYLDIHERTVIRMARAGLLPGVKVGGGRQWRFRMQDIEAWFNKQLNQEQPKTKYKPRQKKDEHDKAS